jgi:hypothetical protein
MVRLASVIKLKNPPVATTLQRAPVSFFMRRTISSTIPT